jgi:hypothetical protein
MEDNSFAPVPVVARRVRSPGHGRSGEAAGITETSDFVREISRDPVRKPTASLCAPPLSVSTPSMHAAIFAADLLERTPALENRLKDVPSRPIPFAPAQ